MKSVRKNMYGTLKFSFDYKVEGVPDRPAPYSRTGLNYRPDELHFVLLSDGYLDDGRHPQYKDLRLFRVSIHGLRLKQDGTPGKQEVNEAPYSCDTLPDWAQEIINEALAELKEGRT